MVKEMSGRSRNRCHSCCTSFISLAFSTLGLLIAVISYSVIGAFLFRHLEAHKEEALLLQTRLDVKNATNIYLTDLWRMTQTAIRNNSGGNETTTDAESVFINKEIWLATAAKITEAHHKVIHDMTKNFQWDGKVNDEPPQLKWTFAGSLLYSVTAITTIGYGHVTPRTKMGQIVTIVYCIIGLPLTLMCIAKMGHAFATAFRIIYHTCCCAICCLACVIRQQNGKDKVVKNSGMDMNDALGALVIGTNERVKKDSVYTPWQVWTQNITTKFGRSLRHDSAVPTYLCLLVMASYIAGGAVLFSYWEEPWDLTEGAYFCFVTLTTIGFGDYVPGIDEMTREGSLSVKDLVLCALYVFVGLALIGMCIDLMQVDVSKKFKWIGRKIGISKPKHTKTLSDTKKEKVGLKLSCEAIPQTASDNVYVRAPISRSASHSLEVPSPSSLLSINSRRSASMPNTPSIPTKSMSSKPIGLSFLPLAMDEEPVSFYTDPININRTSKVNLSVT